MFNYKEMKLAVYCLETAIGALMIVAAFVFFDQANSAIEPITYAAPALVLLAVGIFCLLFGIETYCLRDDPDVWR